MRSLRALLFKHYRVSISESPVEGINQVTPTEFEDHLDRLASQILPLLRSERKLIAEDQDELCHLISSARADRFFTGQIEVRLAGKLWSLFCGMVAEVGQVHHSDPVSIAAWNYQDELQRAFEPDSASNNGDRMTADVESRLFDHRINWVMTLRLQKRFVESDIDALCELVRTAQDEGRLDGLIEVSLVNAYWDTFVAILTEAAHARPPGPSREVILGAAWRYQEELRRVFS